MRGVAVLGLIGIGLLGCSGLTNSLVELGTGMKIEELDDGSVRIIHADGSVQLVGGTALPEGFPLPLPPGEPEIESVIRPESGGVTMATWRLTEADREATILGFYRDWFTQLGHTPREEVADLAGLRTVVLLATVGDELHSVTYTEGYGIKSLVLRIEPRS